MNALVAVLACLAGGAGAVLRYGVDAGITRRLGRRLPWGTFAVNVSGALVLGVLTGLAPAVIPLPAAQVVTAGLLGGYTTFSTASVQAAQLLMDGRRAAAAGSTFGMLAASILAGGVGLLVGRAVGLS